MLILVLISYNTEYSNNWVGNYAWLVPGIDINVLHLYVKCKLRIKLVSMLITEQQYLMHSTSWTIFIAVVITLWLEILLIISYWAILCANFALVNKK